MKLLINGVINFQKILIACDSREHELVVCAGYKAKLFFFRNFFDGSLSNRYFTVLKNHFYFCGDIFIALTTMFTFAKHLTLQSKV